jgi:hypothetical protein
VAVGRVGHCLWIQDTPNVGENLLKIALEREQLQELLSKVTFELKKGRFDSLIAYVSACVQPGATLQSLVDVHASHQVDNEKESQSKLSEIIAGEKESSSRVTELTTGSTRTQACAAFASP